MGNQACLVGGLRLSHSGAKQGLYKLSPPLRYSKYDYDLEKDVDHFAEYVMVSAVVAMFSGPETYIFPANEQGEVTCWGELGGSYRGGMSHAVALEGAGYAIA